MALVTLKTGTFEQGMRPIRHQRTSNESAENTAMTVSTPTNTDAMTKITYVTVVYTGNATVSVLNTLNSGLGATFDALLQSIALSAATTAVWIPDEELILAPGDVLDVLAPALASETSTIVIYSEVF